MERYDLVIPTAMAVENSAPTNHVIRNVEPNFRSRNKLISNSVQIDANIDIIISNARIILTLK
jgi:hypothetical protein